MTEEAVERRVEDRRAQPSAWADPRTWMTLCGLLLAFLGYISSQLSGINNGIQALREANATQKEQISTLRDDVAHLKAQNEAQAQINQTVRDRLAKVELSQAVKP